METLSDVKCPVCELDLSQLNIESRKGHVNDCLEGNHEDESTSDTDSEEDLDPPELKNDEPFAVVCPYLNCGKKYEARFFICHVYRAHKSGNQKHKCPICSLTEDIYSVNVSTNLFKHLQTVHSDLPSVYNVDVNINHNNSNYFEYILDNDQDMECLFCYEKYKKSESVIRFTCFCLYHKNCLEPWLQKEGGNCPLHRNV